jgi:PucR C-terminal helix-turn-helix domain/GGDEF-like domain
VTEALGTSTFIGMNADDTTRQVALIGAELIRRTEQLGIMVASAVRAEIDFYQHAEVVSNDELVESCTANVRFIFGGLAGPRSFDTTPATATGESRAQSRVPLPVVMAAYRVGSHIIWQALLEIVETHDEISRHALLAVTERVWEAQDVYTNAMMAGYRRRATQQAVDDEAERAALTEALFSGAVTAGHSPWEIADLLGLPSRGPYVVVAARTPELGKHALPGIGDKLRSLDIYSAWRLLPELQIGIVHLPSDAAHASLIATLQRTSGHGIGVSPRFDVLSDIGTALRYARIAVAGSTAGEPVVEFEDSVLGVAAVTAPDVNLRLADAVLGGLDGAADRDVLFQTFRVWAARRGSISEAAAALFCHPNTVRHRLRRIEEYTGRSINVPLDLAELCLAFEIDAKLR